VLHGRLDDWEARGVGTAGLFAHSGFGEETAWWIGCPDLAGPPENPDDCAFTADEAGFRAFYDAMSAAGALRPFTNLPDPDWTLFGGGAGSSSNLPGTIGWPDVVGETELPDGDVAEDGMYFGNLAMDPNVPGVLDKEIAPADVRRRLGGMEIHSPADRWDDPAASGRGTLYWPGQTFALSYAYESRASGLLLEDYVELVSPGTAWSVDAYRGDESSDVMSDADFAVNEQYVVGRILARRDTPPTWWYVHFGDVSRTKNDNWLGCADEACEDVALDRFVEEMQRWSAVEWRPRPQ
jgi:hypothetical protein